MEEMYLDFSTIGKIKVIDHGLKLLPTSSYKGDVAYDVYAREDVTLNSCETVALNLGFGLELEPCNAVLVLPRSSIARKGIVVHPAPVDSSYRGPIHAIMTNMSLDQYSIIEGDRVAQIMMFRVFAPRSGGIKEWRGEHAFGSTGR